MIQIPKFDTKKELFSFLVKNKESIIAQKKSEIKHADSIVTIPIISNDKGEAYKAESIIPQDITALKVTAVINTTNYFDSHKDVHWPGIWDKSLQENKLIMHVREHQSQKFDYIISDGSDLKALTRKVSWFDLGFSLPGLTEALIFESNVKKSRNEFMFDQYRRGYVRNHSVGMIYMKMILCVNDEDFGAEYEAWQKYISEVVNRTDAEEDGFMWIQKEAKVIEGSAVPRGSNIITPTLTIEESKSQPELSTDAIINEPAQATRKSQSIDYKYLTNGIKNLKI